MSDEFEAVRWAFAEAEEIPPPERGNTPPRTPNGEGPPPPEDPERARFERCVVLPLNDFGNGQRVIEHFGRDLIFVPRVGWFVWNGRAWRKDPDEMEIRRFVQQIAALIEGELPFLRLTLKQENAEKVREFYRNRDVLAELTALPPDQLTPDQELEIRSLTARNLKLAKVADQATKLYTRRLTHAKNAGNSGPMKNMAGEASVGLSRDFEALDADPLEINVGNGILRFRVDRDGQRQMREDGSSDMEGTAGVEFVEHDRDRLLTKMMPAEYDPDATAPKFEAALERIQPDPEIRAFLRRWFGLNMTGLTDDQVMLFLYGVGANGKSMLMDLIARMLGDYATSAKIESLTGTNRRGGGDATPDLIPLMGARSVRASEPEQGERLQEALIKALTGGEPMLVRALHSDFIEVKPRFKLTISGNHKPEIRGTDDGIWRRVLLVPFDVQIPRDERDPDLGEKLWAERAGILNWMVAGLIDYLENGLQVPKQVMDATQDYREESDPVHSFLADCCEVTGDEIDSIEASKLKDAFRFWQEERGLTPWTDTTCSRRISDKAGKWKDPRTGCTFVKAKSSIMIYRGIKLADMFKKRFDERPQGRSSHSTGFLP